jgi:hypothetical protein
MLLLVVAVIILAAVLGAALFLLGFRLGADQWQGRLAQIRLEASKAERELHDLTRQAFVSMAEAAERRRP